MEQLALFNALLGVIGDHADRPTSVTMTDVASGRDIKLNSSETRFKEPRTWSKEVVDGKTVAQMSFHSLDEANEWIRKQQAKGVDVNIVSVGQKMHYHVGTAHKHLKLGGTEQGMRAIGYIAQTFLAHSFPDIARLPELQAIKDYTLHEIGSGFVWWDFEVPSDLPPNKFAFGHRVIVGLNKDNGTAYARISFFSTLHFAILLGTVQVGANQSVIIDIDPLAKSPPNDIHSWAEDRAAGAVYRPDALTSSLASAISSGKAQTQVSDLMRQISDFERSTAARQILERLVGIAALPKPDRVKLFAEIVRSEAQRVMRLMQGVAEDFRRKTSNPVEAAMATFLEKATELDPTAGNGLTAQATRALTVACDALTKQMREDFESGLLDQNRMEMLIGGGIGMYVIGVTLLHSFEADFSNS